MKLRIISFIMLVSFVSVVSASNITYLTCAGTIVETSFRDDPAKNEILFSDKSGFRVDIASDGRYLIRINEYEGKELFYGYDGVDTYIVEYLLPSTKSSKTVTYAFLSKGCFPYDNRIYFGGVLWSAFGSGTFYHTNSSSSSYPLPFSAPRINAGSYGFRFDARTEDRKPFLPKKITYYRDTNSDLNLNNPLTEVELDASTDPSNPDEYETEINHTKHKYNVNGFCLADFTSDNFTTENGITIPTTFSLRAYDPRWEDAPKLVINGKITSVSNNVSINIIKNDFRPSIKNVINVLDSRFRWRDESLTVDHISYPLKPGETWRSSTDPYLVGIFHRMTKMPLNTSNTSNRKSIIMGLIFITIIACPIWFIWRQIKLQSKK